MNRLLLAIFGMTLFAGAAFAQESAPCDLPGYLIFGDTELKRVADAVKQRKQLEIAVVGSGSSVLAGYEGAARAYPARLQAALRRLLPGITVNVTTQAKIRQTAADMVKTLTKLLVDAKPDLVLWQTGTVDAMRGIDPEEFRATLDDGVEALHSGGADVVLINMQYSPRIETMIQLGTYADNMRVVARDRDVPLFDRLGLMRYWNDNGSFDLYAAAKDSALASQVHDCLGRALAVLVIEAAHLDKLEGKTGQ